MNDGKTVMTMEELEEVMDQATVVGADEVIQKAQQVIDATDKVIKKGEKAERILKQAENVLVQTNYNAAEMKAMGRLDEEKKAKPKLTRVQRIHNEIMARGNTTTAIPDGEYDPTLIRIIEQAIADEEFEGRGADPTEFEFEALPSPWHLPNPRKTIISAKRNDPCPCGSNKKFKKCCWKTMPRYKDRLPKERAIK